VFGHDGWRVADKFRNVLYLHAVLRENASECCSKSVGMGRFLPWAGKLEYLPHTPPPLFRYRSEVHRLADEENVRTMDLFSCPQAGDQPIRDPRKEFLLGFVHAKENIISIQSFGGVEKTNIADPQSGINREHHKIFRVFASPRSRARPSGDRRPKGIARRIDAIEFIIGERGLVG